MADLLAALALLTFAGVAGLVAVLIALYAFSLASEAAPLCGRIRRFRHR